MPPMIPTGQLPVLLIGDEPVADSTLILHRIDEQLAPGSLTRGLDPARAAEAWLWEEFSDTARYPQVLATRWADDRGWPVPGKVFFGSMPPVLRDVVATLVRRETLQVLEGRDLRAPVSRRAKHACSACSITSRPARLRAASGWEILRVWQTSACLLICTHCACRRWRFE